MTIKQQGGIFGRNPTFNDVEANNLDVEALGIGVAANSTNILELSGVAPIMKVTAENGVSGFRLNVSGASSNTFRVQQDGASKLELNGNNLKINSGNLQLATAGQGIDFSATSGTGTSELFDDYEEGTWTPTFGNLTLGDGTSTGTYTKIGDTVTIYGKLVLGSTTTVGGVLSCTNLPFSAASGFNPIGNMRLLDQGTNSFAAQVSVNTTSLTFRSAVANSTYLLWGQVDATTPFTWVATDQLEFNAVYKAA